MIIIDAIRKTFQWRSFLKYEANAIRMLPVAISREPSIGSRIPSSRKTTPVIKAILSLSILDFMVKFSGKVEIKGKRQKAKGKRRKVKGERKKAKGESEVPNNYVAKKW
jgi:hypothetical protein